MAVLAEIWALSPDVRLGQLMAHLAFLGEAPVGKGFGYIEDDELLAVLYRHRAELQGGWSRNPPDRRGVCRLGIVLRAPNKIRKAGSTGLGDFSCLPAFLINFVILR